MATTGPVQMLLDELRVHNETALELAVLLSAAVRIEQPLVRRLRLRFLPTSDPSAEADLWFSPLVRAKSTLGITLRPDVLTALRGMLAVRVDRAKVREVIADAHAALPPLLALEERLVWLGIIEADMDTIQQEFARVIKAMVSSPSRRDDLSAWCVRALPQLPLAARRSAGAWVLRIAAQALVQIAIPLDCDPPSSLADASIPSLLPDVTRDHVITVCRSKDEIIFDSAPSASGFPIRIPGTDPLFVVVDHGGKRELVVVKRGASQSIKITASRIDLRCLRGNHWHLALRPVVIKRPTEQSQPNPSDEVADKQNVLATDAPVSDHVGPSAMVMDPRAVAFCRSDGPEVFSTVAHGSNFHERDPFDVEAIHADARQIFYQQLEEATRPEQAKHGRGRTLLILGDSGAGKTHLLRAFRAQVHGHRLGYVGYVPLNAVVDEHARYVLHCLVDSLEHPYDPPSLTESGLMYLSDGLAEGRGMLSADELERLRTADLSPTDLEQFVGTLVNRIVRAEGMQGLDLDLVHVLLLVQRRDPAMQPRIARFLRGDTLTQYDRQLLGGLGASDQVANPLRIIQQLATIMNETQLAALVVIVDELEQTVLNGITTTQLQQEIDNLRAISNTIPSSVVVISCLDDAYVAFRPKLPQALFDWLSHNKVRLTSQRHTDEIEQLLIRRLHYLYNFFDVSWREDDPLYPFTPTQIEAVSLFRTRDCLGMFRDFQAACMAARSIVPITKSAALPEPPPSSLLDKLWQETLASVTSPDTDAEILALVADALHGAATELGIELENHTATLNDPPSVIVEGKTVRRCLVAVCNNQIQDGSFGAQLASLRLAATKASATPVALRNTDFRFQPKSKAAKHVTRYVAAGGLAISLTESHLRVAVAARRILTLSPADYIPWRRATRPLCSLPFVRQILELDRRATPKVYRVNSTDEVSPQSSGGPAPNDSPDEMRKLEIDHHEPQESVLDSDVEVHANAVRLGVVDSMHSDPIFLPLEAVTTHVVLLGDKGSGKTTVALSIVEQLLERGVSALLVDRKGDLARYASDVWWNNSSQSENERQRKLALRKRIEVELFTPGNSHGRPLRLPLVPALADIKPHARERFARYAANGLGAMMGYRKTAAHMAKLAILQCAITLHGNERDIPLDLLLETINRPTPELFRMVGPLQRHFASLSEDLLVLSIQRGSLLSGDGEPLDLNRLFPPPSAGRPRLSVINTSALAETPVLQFWISRLLVEMNRLCHNRPSATLQAAAFFDEADTYMPATSSPPTKDPMFDLLRGSRAAGIGLLLTTQNPGDFDYRARNNISTWLLGRSTHERTIEKMRKLIPNYTDVDHRLASQRTGSFFLLTGNTRRELRADLSLMNPIQLSETEVADLAKRSRTAAPPVMFTSNDLVELLKEAWETGMPLAHNWIHDLFPGQAQSIRAWCDARGIDWGRPEGYPVQEAQRSERLRTNSRIVAFQQPTGLRRIMFSLSLTENGEAFRAALAIASQAGFQQASMPLP